MNLSSHPRERALDELWRRARADSAAPVDEGALLRAVRQEPLVRPSWWQEFAALFGTRAVLAGCLTGTVAMLFAAGWLVWDAWQHVLPWADLINGGNGLSGGGVL